MGRPERAEVLRDKVALRLVTLGSHYRLELSCRGALKELSGQAEAGDVPLAELALSRALSLLKRPCSVECYIDRDHKLAVDAVRKGTEHQIQPCYLPSGDDPGLRRLALALGRERGLE